MQDLKTCRLVSLPAELLDLIADGIDERLDVVSLSITCRFLRWRLTPKVFDCVTLTNSPKKASSTSVLTQPPVRNHVRRLEYVGMLAFCPSDPPQEDDDFSTERSSRPPQHRRPEDGEKSEEEQFPAVLRSVLSNLSQFPSLRELSVEFEIKTKFNDMKCNLNYLVGDHMDAQIDYRQDFLCDIHSPRTWQRVIAKTYAALASNRVIPSLSVLELPSFLPFAVPDIWESSEWHEFLSPVRTFKLSWLDWTYQGNPPPGGGALDKMGQLRCFSKISSRLDELILHHLRSVEEFELRGNANANANHTFSGCKPISMGPEHMPNLRICKLERCTLTASLVDFLVARAGTLERLILISCCCDERDRFTWKQAWTSLAESGVPRLIHFEYHDSLFEEWYFDEEESDDDDARRDFPTFHFVRDALTRGRHFPYAIWFGNWGYFTHCEGTQFRAIEWGEDVPAYDEFQAVVEANKASLLGQ